jgi:mevalonate pyrophosphate decarboxylase
MLLYFLTSFTGKRNVMATIQYVSSVSVQTSVVNEKTHASHYQERADHERCARRMEDLLQRPSY